MFKSLCSNWWADLSGRFVAHLCRVEDTLFLDLIPSQDQTWPFIGRGRETRSATCIRHYRWRVTNGSPARSADISRLDITEARRFRIADSDRNDLATDTGGRSGRDVSLRRRPKQRCDVDTVTPEGSA